jgi:hypothetical protein
MKDAELSQHSHTKSIRRHATFVTETKCILFQVIYSLVGRYIEDNPIPTELLIKVVYVYTVDLQLNIPKAELYA